MSAGCGSQACPATVSTAMPSSGISSIAAPPRTCRETTSGSVDSTATTLAAIATPSRQATWAMTSPPRGVPPATTDRGSVGGGHDGRRPRGRGIRRERLTIGVPDAGHAVRAELLDDAVRHRSDHQRVDLVAQPAHEGQRLPRHLADSGVVGLDEHEHGHLVTPSFSRRSTTAGAASAPLPSTVTWLGWGSGQREPPAPRARGLTRRCGLLDRHLLGLHASRHRRVARLDATLEDRQDRRQRDVEDLGAAVRRARRVRSRSRR